MANSIFPQHGIPQILVADNGGDLPKEVSTPVETLLGTANGALSGGAISLLASAGVSALKNGKKPGMGLKILEDIAGKHTFAILGATVALGALGGVVRYSRAVKHNEWSQRRYALLQQEAANAGHADTVEASRNRNVPDQGTGR